MGGCTSKESPAVVKSTPAPPPKGAVFEPDEGLKQQQNPASSQNANSAGGGSLPKPGPPRRSDSMLLTLDKSDHNVVVKMEVEVAFGRPIESVYSGVHDGPELGTGISGVVRRVTHKTTGNQYAVKKLDLGNIETEEQMRQLRDEIAIMCQLDHPNVVRLEEVYESPTAIYLVQELCLGGDLFDRLDAQPDECYTEAKCARLMKQIIHAVRYVHSKGIAHRDLKLENFMFSNEGPESELRMIDFGLSKHFEYGDTRNVLSEAVGSAYTVAPEVIRGEYDERCDNWSIGVITYLLLSGETPFGGAGEGRPLTEVRKDILNANYEFEPEFIWKNVSRQAIDFIKALLVTDPDLRPTAKELQQSEWLRVWAAADRREEDNQLNPNVVQALVNFKEQSDMFKLLSEVLSFTLLPEQLEDLRKQFEIMDPEGRGEISLGALKRALVTNAGAGALGSLTEEEVEDMFDAMRIRKTEMRIHWHEFIAAALSQVQIDDRNLELAFERLDTEKKGYIEVENIMELMGGYVDEDEEKMRDMWCDIVKDKGDGENRSAHITKEDFLLLMKGQTQSGTCESKVDATPPLPLGSDAGRAVALPEHTHNDKEVLTSVKDEDASPLVVNRMLYRAHRQMRLAVLEASRKFEEEQMKRTAKKLNEKLSAEASDNNKRSWLYMAGLVMRHGEDAAAPSDSVREMVKQAQKEQEARIALAMRRSGRVHNRKKSFSDMGAMSQLPPIAPPSTPPGSTHHQRKRSSDDTNRLEDHPEEENEHD